MRVSLSDINDLEADGAADGGIFCGGARGCLVQPDVDPRTKYLIIYRLTADVFIWKRALKQFHDPFMEDKNLASPHCIHFIKFLQQVFGIEWS